MSQSIDPRALPTHEKNTVQKNLVRTGCCDLQRLAIGFLAVITLVSVGFAGYFAGRDHSSVNQELLNLPLLNAASAVSDEKYSIATGTVSEEADGFLCPGPQLGAASMQRDLPTGWWKVHGTFQCERE